MKYYINKTISTEFDKADKLATVDPVASILAVENNQLNAIAGDINLNSSE